MRRIVLPTCLLLALAVEAFAAQVVLKKAFVRAHMNRVTLAGSLSLDKAHAAPNRVRSDGLDGDLHVAGRSVEVGLPLVVEMTNAKGQPAARAQINNAVGGSSVPIRGAWRLWFEHPAKEAQVQGARVPRAGDTNPDHVFEIHPLSELGGTSVLTSIDEIAGFEPYEAATAFPYFEGLTATLQASRTSITIEAKKARYNYVGFDMRLTSPPKAVADGTLVLAEVLDPEGNTVVETPRRMAFVAGTAAEAAVKRARVGSRLTALGIPRVNLERVSRLLEESGPGPVAVKLPYEIIIMSAKATNE